MMVVLKKPSQSIKIYRKSLKNFTECDYLIARDTETIIFSGICVEYVQNESEMSPFILNGHLWLVFER